MIDTMKNDSSYTDTSIYLPAYYFNLIEKIEVFWS